MKICKKCGKTKSRSEYSRNTSNWDLRANVCKKCAGESRMLARHYAKPRDSEAGFLPGSPAETYRGHRISSPGCLQRPLLYRV